VSCSSYMESMMDNWKYLLDMITTASVRPDKGDRIADILLALAAVLAERGDTHEEILLTRLADDAREVLALQEEED